MKVEPMSDYLLYLSMFIMAIVTVILLLGLRNMMKGGSANTSQKLMRLRILAQFCAIIVMMGALYFAGK